MLMKEKKYSVYREDNKNKDFLNKLKKSLSDKKISNEEAKSLYEKHKDLEKSNTILTISKTKLKDLAKGLNLKETSSLRKVLNQLRKKSNETEEVKNEELEKVNIKKETNNNNSILEILSNNKNKDNPKYTIPMYKNIDNSVTKKSEVNFEKTITQNNKNTNKEIKPYSLYTFENTDNSGTTKIIFNKNILKIEIVINNFLNEFIGDETIDEDLKEEYLLFINDMYFWNLKWFLKEFNFKESDNWKKVLEIEDISEFKKDISSILKDIKKLWSYNKFLYFINL